MTPAPAKRFPRPPVRGAWMFDQSRMADLTTAHLYSDMGVAPSRVATLANRRRDPDSRAATVSLNDVLAALD